MRSLSKKLRANLAVLLIANIFALAFIARIAIATGNSDGYKVFGYAWSSNVGWMSANSCTETLTCGSTPYGVKIAPDGTFSGRMWSPTIGWISFDANAVSGCPDSVSDATKSCKAHVDINADGTFVTNSTTGNVDVKGWARACAFLIGTSGDPCNASAGYATGTNNNYTDSSNGFTDGFIELSFGDGTCFYPIDGDQIPAAWRGTAHRNTSCVGGWGVSIKPSGNFTGYAWGSDIMGWLSFDGLKTTLPQVVPTVAVVATPNSIVSGSSSVITITAVNIDNEQACDDNGEGWAKNITMHQQLSDSNAPTTWKSDPITVSPTQDTTYTVNCFKNKGGGTNEKKVTDSADVTVTEPPTPVNPPQVTLTATPARIERGSANGSIIHLSASYVSECAIDDSTLNAAMSNPDNSAAIEQDLGTVSPDQTTVYTATCNQKDDKGTVIASVTAQATVTVFMCPAGQSSDSHGECCPQVIKNINGGNCVPDPGLCPIAGQSLDITRQTCCDRKDPVHFDNVTQKCICTKDDIKNKACSQFKKKPVYIEF